VRTSAVVLGRDDDCDGKIATLKGELLSGAATAPVDVRKMHAALAIGDPTARQAAVKAVVDEANKRAVDIAASECVLSGEMDARGLAIELAAATSIGFTDNELDAGALSTSAAWASFAYRTTGASVIGLARLRRDRVTGGRQYVLVPGARGVYATGRVAVSLEGILQKQLAKSDAVADLDVTYRATAALDVRVADSTWVTLSFGKDFGDDSSGKLFSLANLKWGYGDPKISAE
jgi:hypothetical protein